MSEHIQPAPGAHAPHAATIAGAEMQERTPGVSRESEKFSFWLIFKLGVGLGAIIGTIAVINWLLLPRLARRETLPASGPSALAVADAQRPLGRRLVDVPSPRLEGIEPENSLLILRTSEGEEHRFFAAPTIHVRIEEKKDARLFELREGQTVTVAYHMPGGVAGGIGVITTITSPPEKAENKVEPESPHATRTLNGLIVKLEPRGIAAARQWAEVQMGRYGWTDRRQEIVHVPIDDKVIEEVLQSPEFRSKDGKKKGDGRTASPTRSSSGRQPRGGKP